MPSLRQISTSRIAHEMNEPIAQIVISCHNPPSRNGARPSPYLRSGGAMLICHRFQVGPSAAPQTISSVPRIAKNAVSDPEEADVERPHPEVEQVAPDERAAADAVFLFKAEHRHFVSS
jgi:hypothetical protein